MVEVVVAVLVVVVIVVVVCERGRGGGGGSFFWATCNEPWPRCLESYVREYHEKPVKQNC